MVRLYMTVEGQTEQAFASQILVEHLAPFQVFLAKPRLTGPSPRRGGWIPQGGMFNKFAPALEDIRRWLLEDKSPDARFTMMVDLYGLPSDCPGYEEAGKLADPYDRVEALETALADEMGDKRFVPYLQLHEFEALVLSAPDRFGTFLDADDDDATAELVRACQQFKSPEHINHGRQTHPKAQILKHFPDYQQNVDGPLLANEIGLQAMRDACPHFGQWLTELEQLSDQEG
ncbi:MAG: DUF4276 family protein [Planctomycetota bacterium]|nr:DUF4276 family protein [Planctomycetota bacterium]